MVLLKRVGWATRTLQIEARIGNTPLASSFGRRVITANQKCGATSSGSASLSTATFTCRPRRDGRYLSLQSLARMQLNIAEVNVYISGE